MVKHGPPEAVKHSTVEKFSSVKTTRRGPGAAFCLMVMVDVSELKLWC